MSYRIIRVAVSTFIITAMACIPQILAAEEGGDFARSGNRLVHREVFDDPPAAVRAKDRLDARSPAAVVVVGPYISVQVNVDEFGQNIVGDAANEPSIAVNPIFPDNIVIGWRQFDSITSNFRQAGWAFSQDGGQNWTFPGVLTPGIFRSDPVLDSDSSGVIYYQSLQADFDVDVFKSLNGGVTWEDPVPAFGGDKNWMAVDKSGGLGDGHVYGIWQRFFGCCGQNTFTRSTDGAQIFESPVEVVFRPTFGTMAVGPDGEVYAVGIDGTFFQDFNRFVIAKSNNAKNPSASPTFIGRQVDMGGSMVIGGGPNPDGLLGQANVAVDSSNGSTRGNVYMLASVNPPGADPLDIHLIRSMDGGATWDPPVRVNNDPTNNGAWQWFGAHSVAPNGRIDVIWNDTRNSGQSNIAELFYAYSYDAGTTWLGNIPVSPPFDSFVGFPNQNKIGDYYTLISDETGADVAYAATFNGEQDVYYLRVEFNDLFYTPVTPCRIVDTRKAGGAIPPGGIRSYNVRGAVASQGGNPAGCPSPKGEPRAVNINVTSVPLGNGWITAYPYNSTAPTASIVNYRSDAQNVANSGTIKTCFNCAKDVNIKSGGGKTHVVIDVMGYYYSAP